ncbi:MBL fold metallo-hydrolase [Kamptonema animale CS-326]|jgi:glyoxylase-like metal-dependent hydrolase (beta-lactamase superfamily II)/ferredoxin|uniref:MBL fold metallo-hydrolase n=1 Tax=Kamptonema animale TaxID=92934 RepID=UPI00232EFC36|nr:MBL fold metallo-hydrolase [Kamptonema animale]MDB9515306.1 MBL fold metallo-hydrolase [Kamptonema animale CS-326]
MAHLNLRRPENTNGNFYVDTTCIDCDTCRWMAPEIFHQTGEQSAVYHQPANEVEKERSLQALLSCPTSSIGTVEKPKNIKDIQHSFPLLVAENIYHCGYHSEKSYGAASYLIVRPEGNVLVDSPRFSPPLVKQIEAMGDIRYMYLTHQDDVADHQKYRDHFGCDRILHTDEITTDTRDVEIKLSGGEPYQLATDLLIIPVPGHTKGHTVLLYNNKYLFSGDHLAWSDELNQLLAFPRVCWYSWPEQVKSMQKLANYSFEWVLPGHGRRYHADRETMSKQMQQCITWMEGYKLR